MKLNGKKIEGSNYEYIVIPRPTGDLVFKAQAVLDMSLFHELCPLPKPGTILLPGGIKKEDLDDQRYKDALALHGERRYAFMVIQSLAATPELEWCTVKLSDPATWTGWDKEMKDAGFSTNEINHIQMGVATANCLNQEKLDEARLRFLASLAEAAEKQ